MIGIIGYGMVGQAVAIGFPTVEKFIVDPACSSNTIEQLIASKPEAIFVCVPTPDGDDFKIIRSVLEQVRNQYGGLVIVKSTVPDQYIEPYDVVFNPEFLSRKTAAIDFITPPFTIFGGRKELCEQAVLLYNTKSIVVMTNTYVVDMATASLIKYTLNSFYALKVTFMNEVYDAAKKTGADYDKLASIISTHPWVGKQHLQVPGPDGERGFGGPCLPKDARAFVHHYGSELLPLAIKLNRQIRGNDGY